VPNVKTKTFSSMFPLILRQAKEQEVRRNIKNIFKSITWLSFSN